MAMLIPVGFGDASFSPCLRWFSSGNGASSGRP